MTDTAIENGDFLPGSNGTPEKISGTRELFQRAKILLTVPLGNFSYDPELGSRLYELKGESADTAGRALSFSQEALRRLPQVTAESAVFTPGDAPSVKTAVACGDEKTEIEVNL